MHSPIEWLIMSTDQTQPEHPAVKAALAAFPASQHDAVLKRALAREETRHLYFGGLSSALGDHAAGHARDIRHIHASR